MELNINDLEFEIEDDTFLEEYLQEYGEEDIPENIFLEKEQVNQVNQVNQIHGLHPQTPRCEGHRSQKHA